MRVDSPHASSLCGRRGHARHEPRVARLRLRRQQQRQQLADREPLRLDRRPEQLLPPIPHCRANPVCSGQGDPLILPYPPSWGRKARVTKALQPIRRAHAPSGCPDSAADRRHPGTRSGSPWEVPRKYRPASRPAGCDGDRRDRNLPTRDKYRLLGNHGFRPRNSPGTGMPASRREREEHP